MTLQRSVRRCVTVLVVVVVLLAAFIAALSIPARSVAAVGHAPSSSVSHRTAAPSRSPASPGDQVASQAPARGDPPEQAVRRAWQQARDAGRYRFVGDLTQYFYPAPSLAAAGSGPERNELHMEGNADLPAQTLDLKLWQEGGSMSSGGTGIELRMENGVAYTRRFASAGYGSQLAPSGQWEETSDISGVFAPGGDALGFLAGIKNVAEIPPDAKNPSPAYRRYSFEIDGPALARHMRDQLERQLVERGELPVGVTLDTSQEFRQAEGQGELWIDELGLPLRLTVHLAFPAVRDGTHLEADIKNDFSGFPAPAPAPSLFEQPIAWASSALGPQEHAKEWAASGRLLIALAFGAGALAVLVAGRRLRQLYAAVVIAVILSMVVAPVLQNQQVAAFSQEQAEKQARQEQAQQQRAEAARLQAELTGPAWDPNRNPLDASPTANGEQALPAVPVAPTLLTATTASDTDQCDPADTADRDSDGLNNYEECVRGFGPDVPDTDGDGLLDGVEVYQLGTIVDDWDSDFDYITDTLEVVGYPYDPKGGGKVWYLDPRNHDTDGDGLLDSVECIQLLDPNAYTPSTVMSQCDTDGDGTPDPFDLDSDDDGVVDTVDLAPKTWSDRAGLHSSGYKQTNLQPYNWDNPFGLSVSGLEPGWPVLVDVQLRPENTEHIAYALGVLDWPVDTGGQIQHGKNSTWADLQKASGQPSDEASKHGDVRLVPMLEVEMIGSSLPLSLTTQSATFTIGAGTALSTTVKLTPSGSADTLFTFTAPAGSTGLKVYNGTCARLGTQVGGALTGSSTMSGKRVYELADGGHAAIVAGASSSECSQVPRIINGPYVDKMVNTAVLEPYGISFSERDTTLDTPVLMYVPLNVAYDDTGGSKTALQAHMLYWPGIENPWTTAQQMRVVWTVQAITDQCDGTGFPVDLVAYQASDPSRKEATQDDYDAAYRAHCNRYRTADQPQIVHTYDDNWYVTGVRVREDHGMWVSAAYENPRAPANEHYPQPENDLWQLSLGLNSSFLNQRTCETKTDPYHFNPASYDPANGVCSEDTKRDLTIKPVGDSTIGGRFDAAVAASWTITDRWGIPADALRVKTVQYVHQDQIIDIGTTLVPSILKDEFDGWYGPTYAPTLKPTILIAREEYYRAAGFEAAQWVAGTKVLSLDLSDETAYPEQTLTGMNWQTFRYDESTDPVTHKVVGWESIPTTDEMEALEDQLADYFAVIYPTEEDENEVRVDLTAAYYLALNQGVAVLENPCPVLATCRVPPVPNSSGDLAKGEVQAGKGVVSVGTLMIEEAKLIGKRKALSSPIPGESIEKYITQQSGGFSIYKSLGKYKEMAAITIAAGAVMAGAFICLGFLLAKATDDLAIAGLVLQGFGAVLATLNLIGSIGKFVKAYRLGTVTLNPKANWTGAFYDSAGTLVKSKAAMAIVGLALNLILVAGSFLIQMYVGGLAVASMAWDNALASMVASMIVSVVLFVVALILGVVGSVILSALSLVEMFIGAACAAGGVTPQTNAMAYKWGCGGLTGILTNFFKMLFYSGAIMTDMQDGGRLTTGDLRLWLKDEEKGFIKGNSVYYSIVVTDAIRRAEIPPDSIYANAGGKGDWSLDTLKRSTFKYEWTDNSAYTLHDGLNLGDWSNLWRRTTATDVYTQRIVYTQTVASGRSFLLDDTGKLDPSLYLVEGYAVPEQECWAIAGCTIQTERGSAAFNIGKNLEYDVSPNTLTGFRATVRQGDGWHLNWGGSGLRFPALYDADNDGLSGASDADDSVADRDGDTLLDGFEIEIGSNPAVVDTDSDGLWDADEVRHGTDPRLADSDGDGAQDGAELAGWSFVYGLKGGARQTTWVRADPLIPDIDQDTLLDSKEKVYGYNPNVLSNVNVLSLSSELKETNAVTDGFVAPGQTLTYQATVKNELNNRWANGLLEVLPAAGLTTSTVTPREFVLRAEETTSTQGSLVVAPGASGLYTVTQVAGALITDPEEPARGAQLWLPFDDKAVLLHDYSGSVPPHDAACYEAGGSWTSSACGQDNEGQYAGALKLTGAAMVGSTLSVPQTAYAVSLWFKTTTTKVGPLFVLTRHNWGTGLVQIDLRQGEICSLVQKPDVNNDTACASTVYNDGRWHHLVQTIGPDGTASANHKLYYDGLLVATGTLSQMSMEANEVTIGSYFFGPQTGFTGSVDDVRVYDHALAPADVQTLHDQAVLKLSFDDQTNHLKDSSPLGTTLTCSATRCPGKVMGLAQYGASLSGEQWATTNAGAGLNLGGGHLTLAAWLYPATANATVDAWPQGVLGYHSGEADGYPTLQRYGNKVRFGFGATTATGNKWLQYETGDVLVPNTWNHVAVTYDQDDHTVRVYVNGQLKGGPDSTAFVNATGLVANATPAIDIGRSGDLTSVKVSLPAICDNGEYRCGLLTGCDQQPAEWCFALNGKQLLSLNDVYAGNRPETATGFFRNEGTVDLWEDDVDPVCGNAPTAGDNWASFDRDDTFSSNEVGNMADLKVWYNFSDSYQDWCGYIKFELSNTSIPFHGTVDDVRIYNQTLDAERVYRLYREGGAALRLLLDDPPGTRNFSQASAVRAEIGCTSCPVAGLPGRVDQAVSFNGSNYLVISNSPVNRVGMGLTAAAWIKPQSLSGYQRIASTAYNLSQDGWGFGLSDAHPTFSTYFVQEFTLSSVTLEPGVWHHLAAVVSGSRNVTFYVDGVAKGTINGTADAKPDASDALIVGASIPASGTPFEFFRGMIDDLQIFTRALTDAEVKAIYDEAPVMHLRFDEAHGATSFADSARQGVTGACSGSACPVTGDAAKGQIGLAAEFDGQDDVAALDDAALLKPAAWTVGAWVKPAGTKTTSQTLVRKGSGTAINYRLSIDANSLAPRLETCSSYVTSTIKLVQGQWSQVMGTYDGSTLRLYVNGSEANSKAVSGACNTSTEKVYVGADASDNRLAGALDEVALYPLALRSDKISELYEYQNGWVEDRESQGIVVDADTPTAEVLLPAGQTTYLPLRDTQIPIMASDDAPSGRGVSGIAAAVLCVNGSCGAAAPHCTNPNQTSAWCPAFKPGGEGSYSLTARATDGVGQTGAQSAARTVRIDNSPPSNVTLTGAAGQRLDATPDPASVNSWRVHLSGTASDPNSGSGIPEDGVRVSVYDAAGGLAGPARQIATLSGTSWSLDYPLNDSRPAGCYSVVVEASDGLASLAGLTSTEMQRHRTTITATVGINASAPSVQLERAWLSTHSTISGTAAVGGVATSRPVTVKLTWTTGARGAEAALSLACSAPGSPGTYTPFNVPAGRLAANSSDSWAGEIQRDATCQVVIAAPAGSAAVPNGTISVCGEQKSTWSDNGAASQTVSFTASSTACAPDTCGGVTATAGVGRVDIAYTPLLPGSAFVEEAPPSGEVLHLRFDETAAPFSDASGGGHDGACTGSTCPTAATGRFGGALHFDGIDDVVSVPHSEAFNFAGNQDFTVALWAKADGVGSIHGWSYLISKRGAGTSAFPYNILVSCQWPSDSRWGEVDFRRRDDRNTELWLYGHARIFDGGWHHVAVVRSGGSTGTLSMYVDGTLDVQAADPVAITTTNTLPIEIGSETNIGMDVGFAGLIDDVRIFNRGLPAADIAALYAGTNLSGSTGPADTGPVLQLGFEAAWATNTATIEDTSGAGRHGTLNAGDTANRAVAGQVGTHALTLNGSTDWVSIKESPALKLTDQGTISAWIYPTVDQTAPFVNREGEYEIYRNKGGAIEWAFANTKPGWAFINTGKVALMNTWTHVAVVYDGGVVRTYVNGESTPHTYNGSGSIVDVQPTYNELWLGARPTSSERFGGALDDVRIYPRSLTVEEIKGLYLAGWQQATLNPAGSQTTPATRWSAASPLPGGLEGSYRLDLRAWDAAATSPHAEMMPIVSTEERASPSWNTDVDTTAPRVTLCRTGTAGAYSYTALAQDFNLGTSGFRSPCGAGVITSRNYFDSPWYTAIAPGTQRLFGLAATCTVSAIPADEQAYACDSAGNCGQSSGLSTGAACSTEGYTATGYAAPAGSAEPSLASAEAEEVLAAAEEAVAACGKPQCPTIAFVPQVYTTTHFYPPRGLKVTGLVSGASHITAVDVAVGGTGGSATLSEPAPAWPFTRTWSYMHLLPEGPLPDGITVRAVATATVAGATHAAAPAAAAVAAAGQRLFIPLVLNASGAQGTYSVEETLTVDVVPPASVDLALTADGAAIHSGATLRSSAPELVLGWTPSNDGSGIGGYLARWSATSAETTTLSTHPHGPGGAFEDRYTAGEARRVQADLGIRDAYGNERWQEWGAVYVDGPHTPDYVALGEYDGWMDSGCSRLGADRRSTRGAAASFGRGAQQMFASWDRQALRLAWTGANWNGMGDLFVYLDTGPDGTEQVFTPYATPENGTVISLPAGFGADYLVWVHSSEQATLLAWNGQAWSEIRALSGGEFRFDASRRDGQTDLYLQFEPLGLSPSSSLGLLALAAEEPEDGRSLELWATLPLANPVNSPRVSRWAGLLEQVPDFSLLQAYRWPALGDGVCPSGTPSGDLEVTITADPDGVSYSRQGSGLFWLPDPDQIVAAVGSMEHNLLAPRNPPLRDGQAVAYTLRYRNLSDQTATGVNVVAAARGQLSMDEQTFNLGDVDPGAQGEVTFQAVVDRSKGDLPIAAVGAQVYDAMHGPEGPALEWALAAHRVDRGAPDSGQVELGRRIGPKSLRLTGQATDESGVEEVTVRVQGPNETQELTCPVARALEGRWSCTFAPDSLPPDETELTVQVRATDIFGQTGPWSDPQTVAFDAAAPEVTFDEAASGVRAGGRGSYADLVAGHTLMLFGTATDPSEVGAVSVCVQGPGIDEQCGTAQLQANGAWSYRTPDLGALDTVSRTLTIAAEDAVGNRTPEPLVVPLTVDNVAPVLAASQVTNEVMLGRSTTVLSGTVEDGSEVDGGPTVDVSVRVDPPVGETYRADTTSDESGWRFDLAGTQAGLYTLWVDADDAAGNRTSAGPVEVEVTCADAVVRAAALVAEPSEAGATWLRLKTTIRNDGPDAVPAGLPIVLYGPADPPTSTLLAIGTVTTTVALAAGESESLAVDWATGATGHVNIDVAAAGGGITYAGDVALCSRPEPARFPVSLPKVALYGGWSLISPPVEPFNPDVEAVQRPIAGSYRAILGYDDGLQRYDPERPAQATLTTIGAGHGYWIRTKDAGAPIPTGEGWLPKPVATLRMAGETVPEGQPLGLPAGWNLVGYLPRLSLPVTMALEGIEGSYASVLGFNGTAVSYYPDLGPEYNTLAQLRPSAGYWISATQPVTLEYPSTVSMTLPITGTPTMTDTLALLHRLIRARATEAAAEVQQTYTWLNLYGSAYLPDGSPAPISTTVIALASAVPCGATVVSSEGRFGLLACYGDDETTGERDGARTGDVLTFLVDGQPTAALPRRFNGGAIPAGLELSWTTMGDRWEVQLGAPLTVDVAIAKMVEPVVVTPGSTVTYTLVYSNAGNTRAQGVVLSDLLPLELEPAAHTPGADEEAGGRRLTWALPDLEPGAGGTITVTAVVSPALASQVVISNTAAITATGDAASENNLAQAALQVDLAPVEPRTDIYMPLILRGN